MAKNDMVNYFLTAKGNPKVCVATEPLWYIPYSLYAPFATLFMSNLGVSDVQIGLLLSVGMIIQVFAAFFGGVITDKLGRRVTTLLADLISWSLPCLIWAFSQNFWWFLVAAVFNSIWQVSNISWSSLLVEDSEPSKLVYAYSWINIASCLSVFFAPISYLLMGHFDMVNVVRGLYLFSFVSMTAKFVILFSLSHETEQGKKRMRETKHVPLTKLMIGYKDVFIKLIKSKEMVIALFVMLSFNITNTISANFFGLYATKALGIDDGLLAIFSMVTAAVTLIIMFTLQTKLNRLPFRPVMVAGYILFIVSNMLLIFSPKQSVISMIIYSIINAFAIACVSPRKDSLAAQFVDKQDRSRVSALIYMIMIGITSPFGTLIGFLSEMNRVYPFILAIVIFLISALVVLSSGAIKKLDKEKLSA